MNTMQKKACGFLCAGMAKQKNGTSVETFKFSGIVVFELDNNNKLSFVIKVVHSKNQAVSGKYFGCGATAPDYFREMEGSIPRTWLPWPAVIDVTATARLPYGDEMDIDELCTNVTWLHKSPNFVATMSKSISLGKVYPPMDFNKTQQLIKDGKLDEFGFSAGTPRTYSEYYNVPLLSSSDPNKVACAQLLDAMASGNYLGLKCIKLFGPPSSGKTSFILSWCQAHQVPCILVSGNAAMDWQDLFRVVGPDQTGKIVVMKTTLKEVLDLGGSFVLLVDEFDCCNQLCCNDAASFISEGTIVIPPEVMHISADRMPIVVLAHNPGTIGASEINTKIDSRCASFYFGPIPKEELINRLIFTAGLSSWGNDDVAKEFATGVVEFAEAFNQATVEDHTQVDMRQMSYLSTLLLRAGDTSPLDSFVAGLFPKSDNPDGMAKVALGLTGVSAAVNKIKSSICKAQGALPYPNDDEYYSDDDVASLAAEEEEDDSSSAPSSDDEYLNAANSAVNDAYASGVDANVSNL